MALDGLNCFGPNHNDWRLALHAKAVNTLNDFDLPAITNSGAHSPPGSTRWIEADDGGTKTFLVLTLVDTTFTLKSFVWWAFRAFRLQGTIETGQSSKLFAYRAANNTDRHIYWRWSSSGKVNFGLMGSDWGPNEFTFDADTSLLLEYDDAANKDRLYVNDVLELEITNNGGAAAPHTNGNISLYNPEAGTNPLHYWSGILHCQSNTESDRPKATTLFVHGLEGTSDGTDSDYGDETYDGAGDTDQDAVFGDVDLDGSDQVETTFYWKAGGVDAF